MKYLKWTLGTLLLAVVPVLATVSVARAQHFSANVEEGQTIHSSVYSVGSNVTVRGTIYGDVFCAGQTVKVDAHVYGDVICAGQDITISGKIEGDVRAAGQVVAIQAEIGKNATVVAMNFSLDAGAKVGQDLSANGDMLNVKGSVGRDFTSGGSKVLLNGPIGRNAKVTSEQVQLKDMAHIGGDFNYTSHKDAQVDRQAHVAGKTNHDVPPKKRGFNVVFYLYVLFGLTLIVLALAFFFPKFMRRTSNNLVERFPRALLVGITASFLLPLGFVGLAMSFVGIPLAFVLLLAGLLAAVLSGPITAYYIGRIVLRKSKDPLLFALVGSLIVVSTYFLPMIGLICLVVAYWLGLGALLLEVKNHIRFGTEQAPAKSKAGK